MSITIAESRRGEELRQLRHRHELAVRAAEAPDALSTALGGDYSRLAAEQKRQRQQAVDELEVQITDLERLKDDELISRFVPEAFQV